MSAVDRASRLKTAAVFDFMRERRITLDDLINVGGEDKSPKVRKVEDAWALMARLGVVFADLEAVADAVTVERPSAQRGDQPDEKSQRSQVDTAPEREPRISLENKGLENSPSVGVSAKRSGRWQKRKLRPDTDEVAA